MALEDTKTITLHLNDSNRKILEPIIAEATAKAEATGKKITLSQAVIDKLASISEPLEDPIEKNNKAAQEIKTDIEIDMPFDEAVERAEAAAARRAEETEAEEGAENTVETSDSPVTKIALDVTAFDDAEEYYKVRIEREDGSSDTMEWLPKDNADSDENTEENVLQFISNNNISPATEVAVEALSSDVRDDDYDEDEDEELDDDEENEAEDTVVVRTATIADLDSKAVRKRLAFNEEEDEIYDDLKKILKALKDLEQLREDYPIGQVAEVERDEDDYDEDEDEERDDDDWDEEEDEDEDYDEDEDDYDEDEDEDEEEEQERRSSGDSYSDYY